MSRTGEILLAHGEAYRRLHGSRMTPDQFRATRALAACHTPALGGVRWQCPRCGGAAFAWRSCGNRHCPACGHADAKLWLERQTRLLLPGVTYHLATFTVPDGLRRAVHAHPAEALPLLFEASSSALLDLCRDRRHLGGTPALTAVLHTWTRQMLYHPHVHFIASGGGLAPDGSPPLFRFDLYCYGSRSRYFSKISAIHNSQFAIHNWLRPQAALRSFPVVIWTAKRGIAVRFNFTGTCFWQPVVLDQEVPGLLDLRQRTVN
jgi:hypothetical protein